MIYLAGTDFSHLTNDELIKGIKALKLPDYIRSKAYGIDVRETLAQMTEMTIQLGVNMGLSPDDALEMVKKLQDIDAQLAQTATKEELNSLGQLKLEEIHETLTDLQNAYPSGAEGLHLVVADGYAYRWDSTSWVQTVKFQSDGIPENYITAEQTAFTKIGINKFNKNDAENADGKYLGGTGYFNTASGYSTTHKIECKLGDIIRRNTATNENYNGNVLGANGQFLENIGVQTFDGSYWEYEVTNPDASYVRLNIHWYSMTENGLMITVNDEIPTEYEPFAYILDETYLFNESQKAYIEDKTGNKLYGKTALFNGDSICFGAGWRPLKSDGSRDWTAPTGYAKIIGDENNMTVVNYGAGGATVARGTIYSDTQEDRHWIGVDVPNMQSEADYIIFQGGINDYWNSVPLGSVTADFSSTLDTTTFCGALENLLKESQLKWKGKKLGFIISHKITTTYDLANKNKSELYWNKAREICEKWSIPYLDLFNESGLNYGIDTIRTTYSSVGDGCHPTEAGYREFLAPKIEAWMKTL